MSSTEPQPDACSMCLAHIFRFKYKTIFPRLYSPSWRLTDTSVVIHRHILIRLLFCAWKVGSGREWDYYPDVYISQESDWMQWSRFYPLKGQEFFYWDTKSSCCYVCVGIWDEALEAWNWPTASLLYRSVIHGVVPLFSPHILVVRLAVFFFMYYPMLHWQFHLLCMGYIFGFGNDFHIRLLNLACHVKPYLHFSWPPVAYPGILFGGGVVQQIQLRTEDRENGDLRGSSPLVRGSGGSCNLVQEISFHIVKFS